MSIASVVNWLIRRRLGGLKTEDVKTESDRVRQGYSEAVQELLNDLTAGRVQSKESDRWPSSDVM